MRYIRSLFPSVESVSTFVRFGIGRFVQLYKSQHDQMRREEMATPRRTGPAICAKTPTLLDERVYTVHLGTTKRADRRFYIRLIRRYRSW